MPSRRRPRTVPDVRDAVLAILGSEGWSAVTHTRVAARAGVHRATVKRRWPSRGDLVRDAFSASAADTVGAPDTGALRTDLDQLLARAAREAARNRVLLLGVLGALATDPAGESGPVGRIFWGAREEVVAQVLRRAAERGEPVDPARARGVFEVLAGALWVHVVVRGLRAERPWREVVVAAASCAARGEGTPAAGAVALLAASEGSAASAGATGQR